MINAEPRIAQQLMEEGAYVPLHLTETVTSVSPAVNETQGVVASRRSGLTVGKLRDLIRHLPDSMDVRFYASVADECHVEVVETYKDPRGGTLMLADARGDFAGATVLFDETE